jgi:UDP-N-acetylglucosamine/UDP-N-acetylgalactosamine diphosphorylase
MSSKMVAKLYGMEKLGNFCLVNGELTVVEYSDLPEELAEQRTDAGELRFRAGSPAIHVLSRDFVRQLNASGRLDLPFHRADKKVPHVDVETGKHLEPDEPNAVKLEMFVFDALPKCQTSIILETDRKEEMAFIKNATGESSPESSKQDQTNRNGRWLEQAGVTVPRRENGDVDAVIEISYLTAIAPEDLRDADLPDRIEPGETVVI